MKLTIDSQDPIEHVMAVVQAMYGVQLQRTEPERGESQGAEPLNERTKQDKTRVIAPRD